jgi:hypothetical protein
MTDGEQIVPRRGLGGKKPDFRESRSAGSPGRNRTCIFSLGN